MSGIERYLVPGSSIIRTIQESGIGMCATRQLVGLSCCFVASLLLVWFTFVYGLEVLVRHSPAIHACMIGMSETAWSIPM